MIENKRLNRKFIKEALGTRNYFSYRTDLMLYKIMLSILVMLVIYLITADWSFSILISAEVFVIFTLVNKLNIARKKHEGEEKLILKMKREHFKKKIDEINADDFVLLIGFLYEKKGCKNFVNKGRHMYLAEKDGLINCIKIYKLYDAIELEKIDVRNMLGFMCQNSIKIGHLITTGNLSKDAEELLEKFKDKLDINVVDIDKLFSMMEEHNILPDKEFFYEKVCEDKFIEKKKIKLKKNIFDNKKTFIYTMAAVFFYITSMVMPDNNLSRYISYYFVLLTVISVFYLVWIRYISLETK